MAGPLKVYDVTVNGFPTRMKLTETDAVRFGGVPVERPVQDKARRPRQTRGRSAPDEVEVKTAEPGPIVKAVVRRDDSGS